MPAYEQIVRPWQSPGVINDKKTRVTRVKSVNTQRAIIRWGSAGEGPETKQVGVKVTVKGSDVNKAFTEVSRKTTNIRIQNPNDPNQYVIAQRPDEVKFSRPKPFSNNRSGQPTNVAPGSQEVLGGSQSGGAGGGSGLISGGTPSTQVFNDGSSGTTIIKSSASSTPSNVNGNSNATATSTAGTNTTTAQKRTETSTFILKWDDVPP